MQVLVFSMLQERAATRVNVHVEHGSSLSCEGHGEDGHLSRNITIKRTSRS